MKTENHRVLIIDDERPVLMTLEALLKRHGYQVETAPTAAQGIKVLKSKSPTLVLLDLQPPDATGLEMRDGIKTDAAPTISSASLTRPKNCLAWWRKHWKNSSSCEKPNICGKERSNSKSVWRSRRPGPRRFLRVNPCRRSDVYSSD